MKAINFTFLIVLSGVLILSSCKKKPSAGFSVSDETPEINQFLIFTNTSVDGYSYEWDFGDGTRSTKKHPTHHYIAAGSYEVTLKVYSKKEKKEDEYAKTLTILKMTKDELVSVWNYDRLRAKSYQNGLLTSDTPFILSDLYSIHTLEFKTNNTYLTNLDGSYDTGNWSVVTEGQSILIDGDLVTIAELTNNYFEFYMRDEYTSGGNVYVDTTWGYMSK